MNHKRLRKQFKATPEVGRWLKYHKQKTKPMAPITTDEIPADFAQYQSESKACCETCEHWRPEPRHKLWGRCGRVDHAMQYGAITEYPYDQKNDILRVRLSQFDNRGRIATYRDFGCNRYSPNNKSSQPGT